MKVIKKSILIAMLLAVVPQLVASCSPKKEFSFRDGVHGGTGGSSGSDGGDSSKGGTSTFAGGNGAKGGASAAGEAGSGTAGDGDCAAQEKLCDGVCVAISDPTYGCDATLCDASRCPSSEGGTLACVAGECVVGECGDGKKNCAGECVSLADPAFGCGVATCDASPCPSQATGGTVVCEGEACVIGVCPDGYKECGNKCVAVADPTYGCGATSCDATSCPAAGSGTLICQGGACIIGTCGAGTKKCGDKCATTDANNGCAESGRCTACANNEACLGSPSQCECVPTVKATACAGKCDSVPNGCGGMHVCGTCTAPKSCGGGGIANVCGCTKTPMGTACSGKSCGTVSDGCGSTYTCGSCTSSSAPVCVSGGCKQCANFSDCPAGSFDCSNNVCTCRTPASANVLKDAGFDSATVLNSWAPSDATWSSGDSDGCPGSGSVMVTGSISRCFQDAAGEFEYELGFRYKQAAESTSGCLGLYYQDRACTQPVGVNFLSTPAGADTAGSWYGSSTTGYSPEGTRSILVECFGNGATMQIDQIYLRAPGSAGSGF